MKSNQPLKEFMEAKRDRSAWLKGPAFPCEVTAPNVARPFVDARPVYPSANSDVVPAPVG